MFFRCTLDTIDLHSRFSSAPIYAYYYAHRGLFTFPMMFLPDNSPELGVSHGDDILLEFAPPFLPPLLLQGDIETSEILVDLWSSFAATGYGQNQIRSKVLSWENCNFFIFNSISSYRVPTTNVSNVAWDPVQSGHMKFLKINNGTASMVVGDYPFTERASKWQPLFRSVRKLNL